MLIKNIATDSLHKVYTCDVVGVILRNDTYYVYANDYRGEDELVCIAVEDLSVIKEIEKDGFIQFENGSLVNPSFVTEIALVGDTRVFYFGGVTTQTGAEFTMGIPNSDDFEEKMIEIFKTH